MQFRDKLASWFNLSGKEVGTIWHCLYQEAIYGWTQPQCIALLDNCLLITEEISKGETQNISLLKDYP
nr:CBM_HP1_G0009500.mRNA.1.CDS.1 [Saccharomyces cerevisiae]